MQTGVSTASLFLRKYNEDAIALFHTLGIKTAELFLTTYSEYGEDFARKINSIKKDMDIRSLHILNTQFEPQLFAKQQRVKDDAFGWLHTVLKGAKALDVPNYTFHGTARVKSASRSGNLDDFPSIIKAFQEITAVCQNYGVTLCLENVEWATYNRPGVFEKVSKEVPSLRGVLDIKQARISGYGYEEYLNEMGEKLTTVHLSDIDEQGKMCLPGKGCFNFTTLIKRLKDVGFDGALLIEVYANDYAEEKELLYSCQYLEELIYKLNA